MNGPAIPSVPTAQQHAVDSLRRLMVSGALRPGQRVNQEDVAARAGLSVAPVREALRVLEQEGQLTYRPRRGYFVTELQYDDLREIYELRKVLEERAARHALPTMDAGTLERVEEAARACAEAAAAGDVAAELAANRTFHFAIVEAPGQPHVLRLIRLLWDSTEVYRAMYYNLPEERTASVHAHDRILDALRAGDADRLVRELDDHRDRALEVLHRVLT
ncbi:GntR family transcriptional regulator [Spirillospora sp. NPDC029432]|uniref:GntR family transcriptional regulator n=1 Tax=Spirillospora sp. NPDC029432 TaxID=3154599 RepID=UPI0034536771